MAADRISCRARLSARATARHRSGPARHRWCGATRCAPYGIQLREKAIMHFESSVTSVSWIPWQAVTGPARIPFDRGVTHYDALSEA
jgi:hypothetical protein